MRSEAMTKFQCENMPDGGRGTRVFFDKLWEKAGMPENARICDKLMLALPLELSPEQRHEAVHSFMQQLGQGRIVWCAPITSKARIATIPTRISCSRTRTSHGPQGYRHHNQCARRA